MFDIILYHCQVYSKNYYKSNSLQVNECEISYHRFAHDSCSQY